MYVLGTVDVEQEVRYTRLLLCWYTAPWCTYMAYVLISAAVLNRRKCKEVALEMVLSWQMYVLPHKEAGSTSLIPSGHSIRTPGQPVLVAMPARCRKDTRLPNIKAGLIKCNSWGSTTVLSTQFDHFGSRRERTHKHITHWKQIDKENCRRIKHQQESLPATQHLVTLKICWCCLELYSRPSRTMSSIRDSYSSGRK